MNYKANTILPILNKICNCIPNATEKIQIIHLCSRNAVVKVQHCLSM